MDAVQRCSGSTVDEEPSADQIAQLADMARRQLSQGWIGVDFEPEYAPGTTFEEMLARGQGGRGVRGALLLPRPLLGGRHQRRRPSTRSSRSPSSPARRSTSSTSSAPAAPSTWPASLARVEKARAEGHDVTACMYPYNYWATYIQSTRFADGWQERFRITYSDLQVAGTTERLTEGTFDALRGGGPEDNKLTAAFAIPEADVDTCIQAPVGDDRQRRHPHRRQQPPARHRLLRPHPRPVRPGEGPDLAGRRRSPR